MTDEKNRELKRRKPVRVRNADIPLLSNVLNIMCRVEALEERQEWQQERMSKITRHLTGMPGGGGLAKGLDDAFSMLSEIEEEHEIECCEYVTALQKARAVLNSIKSEGMRAFVERKYVMDTPDAEIRSKLHMSRRSFERARKSVEEADCMAHVRWEEKYVLITRAK